MAQASSALQFQFDVIKGTIVSVQLVRELLKACQEDDLQPLTISSLESFGQWLSVDSERLNQGDDALTAASSRNKVVEFASRILLGPSTGGIIGQMRKNIHLTASFLFVAACNTLSVEKAAELIHELLRLTGAVERNGTPRNQISQFVQRIRGLKDYIPGRHRQMFSYRYPTLFSV